MPEPESPPSPVTGPPWAARAPQGATTALAAAARLGAYCWVEQQLFSLLGGWVTDVPEAEVKLVVAELAEHAGWRARRWHELLPTAPPGPDALVAAAEGVAAAVGAAATVAGGPDRTLEKLAVAHRVLLPRLAAALRAHLDWAPAVSEPATRRVLGIALDDVTADWLLGERVLQSVATDPQALARVAAAQAAVEGPIAAAGGIVGPASTGRRPRGWRA